MPPAAAGAGALEKLSAGELYSMLRFGADRIFASDEGEPPSDAELAAIIDRSVDLGAKGAPPRSRAHAAHGSACTCQLQGRPLSIAWMYPRSTPDRPCHWSRELNHLTSPDQHHGG